MELLEKLQLEVISPASIEFVLGRLEDEIGKSLGQLDADLLAMQQRKEKLEKELSNLTRVLSDGFESPSVRAAIAERERELTELITKVGGRKKNSIRNQVKNLRTFVEASMGDLRELLTGRHGNPFAVRMELAKHVKEIVLLPEGNGKAIKYSGSWELLGPGVMECAEGQS